jgi:hypothetical protein
MNANNLTFEQIKELAEIAAKNKCDFNLDMSGEDINIYINQNKENTVTQIPYNPYIPYDPYLYQRILYNKTEDKTAERPWWNEIQVTCTSNLTN